MKEVVTRERLIPLDMGQYNTVSGFGTMVGTPWRRGQRAIELSPEDGDSVKLRSIAQSRMEPARRVERCGYLLEDRTEEKLLRASSGTKRN
jgi:hypothetical protein